MAALSQLKLAFTGYGVRRVAAGYDFVIAMHRDSAKHYLRGFGGPHAIIDPDPSLHRADQRLQFVSALTDRRIDPEDRQYVVVWDAAHLESIDRYLSDYRPTDCRFGFHLGCGTTSVHGWKFWFPGRSRDRKL